MTPEHKELYEQYWRKFGLREEPKPCSATQAAKYLAVTSKRPDITVDRIYYYTGEWTGLDAKSQLISTIGGTRRQMIAEPLDTRLTSVHNNAIKTMKKMGINLKRFPGREQFEDNVRAGKTHGNNLLVRVIMVNTDANPTWGGGADTQFRPVPGYESLGVKMYTTSISISSSAPNPLAIFLHEWAHIFGVGHMGQNFNMYHPDCMNSDQGLTRTQQNKLQSLQVGEQCIVDYTNCKSTMMWCAPHPNCLASIKPSSADKKIMLEQYKQLIGTINKKRPKTKATKRRPRTELVQYCNEYDNASCIQFQPADFTLPIQSPLPLGAPDNHPTVDCYLYNGGNAALLFLFFFRMIRMLWR